MPRGHGEVDLRAYPLRVMRDSIVVEFPGSKFNRQIAPALLDLVERDLIRVLDLLVLKKNADGSLEAFELSDMDEKEIGELRTYESELGCC